ncbi:MAG TPA: nucleoside recognition domain-containing protein [Chitinophagales bacterium]|nr:nucleoside recognition domain-containing protein [Chitinophagales bacterium]
MVLNYLWVLFFLVSFLIAIIKLIAGDTQVITQMVNSTFDMSKTAFEISLGLTGVMTLWLGLMKVGEAGGAIKVISKIVGPFFSRLFPEIPKDHPAMGSILMNFSANMLGLDNAATPLGLKAMKEIQSLNPTPERASNAMIMFLTINTAGLTIIPVSILAFRTQAGAVNPTDIFLPLLIATYGSLIISVFILALIQKINLLDKVLIAYFVGISGFIGGLVYMIRSFPLEKMSKVIDVSGNLIIMTIIVIFIALAFFKKINVYETFIDGAKEGFQVSITIIPYLVAMLVGIGLLRSSGTMDIVTQGISSLVAWLGMDTSFTDALPVAFMKPFSGSGARGLMVDAMNEYGADSFTGRLSCIMNGATDTTFYILALYFGSVGVKNTRYAAGIGLLADFIGVTFAITLAYIFFM